MSDQYDPLALKLFVVLARAHLAVERHVVAEMTRHELTHGEFGVMEALYHKGPLLLGEVQKKILASSGGVTYIVDRLVAQGLVERQDCATDKRARYAVLTAKGQEAMRRIFPDHAAAIERAVSGLSAEEKQQAIDLLRKLGITAADMPIVSGARAGMTAAR